MSMLKYVTVGEGKRRKADPGDGGAGGETDRAEDGASAGGPGAAAGETGHGKVVTVVTLTLAERILCFAYTTYRVVKLV